MRRHQRAISKIEKDFNLKMHLLICKICAEENSRIAMMMPWVCFLCGSDNAMMNIDMEDNSQKKKKDVYKIGV